MRRRILIAALALCAGACTISHEPVPGALLLSNRDWPPSQVDFVVTASPECNTGGPGYVTSGSFVLPPQATRIIAAPPGADVCWRRLQDPPWPGWSRAFLAPGRTVDSAL